MSEPTRYDFDEYGGCYELSHGDYILHSDYEKEVSRLKAEVERLTDTLNKLVKTPPEATGGVRVKVDFWTQYGSRLPSSYETFWENAAKEGKQS